MRGASGDSKRDYFTDHRLVTQDGKTLRFYTDLLRDKVVIINFFYVNCSTVCPLQGTVLNDLQTLLGDHLGRDIVMISITVDPEHDSPEVVRDYARVFNPKKGWVFLTGRKDIVNWVNYKLGGYTEVPAEHSTLYLLGNVRTGHWMKVKPDAKAKALAGYLMDLLEEKE